MVVSALQTMIIISLCILRNKQTNTQRKQKKSISHIVTFMDKLCFSTKTSILSVYLIGSDRNFSKINLDKHVLMPIEFLKFKSFLDPNQSLATDQRQGGGGLWVIPRSPASHSGGFRGGPGLPLFAQNLPSNLSKTEDLRPKICDFFAISGGAPPLPERPPFKISGSATVTCKYSHP
jgi:hypothetical protein